MKDLRGLVKKASKLIDELGDVIEEIVNGHDGQVNLRVYHNQGCESIDLHKLNGEFDLEVLKVKRVVGA